MSTPHLSKRDSSCWRIFYSTHHRTGHSYQTQFPLSSTNLVTFTGFAPILEMWPIMRIPLFILPPYMATEPPVGYSTHKLYWYYYHLLYLAYILGSLMTWSSYPRLYLWGCYWLLSSTTTNPSQSLLLWTSYIRYPTSLTYIATLNMIFIGTNSNCLDQLLFIMLWITKPHICMCWSNKLGVVSLVIELSKMTLDYVHLIWTIPLYNNKVVEMAMSS